METRKDFLSPHEWQRRSGVELLRNRVDLAAAFQSPNIVLHIDINDNVFGSEAAERAFFDPLFQSLDEIRPYCVEKGIQIAAETLLCANAQNFLNLYDRLFVRYGKEFIGVCFDCGHWELIEPGKLSVLERFADRLIATHIHDNFGAMDNHLLPFDGRLDWHTITSRSPQLLIRLRSTSRRQWTGMGFQNPPTIAALTVLLLGSRRWSPRRARGKAHDGECAYPRQSSTTS